MLHRRLHSAIVFAVLLYSASASADTAPPPGYEETCTRAHVEAADEYCQLVFTEYTDPYGCLGQQLDGLRNAPADASLCSSAAAELTEADCCQVWLDNGYTYECQPWVATQAMWCRERRDGDPELPAETATDNGSSDDGTGCSIGTASNTAPPIMLALVALGALGALARRRRDRTSRVSSRLR